MPAGETVLPPGGRQVPPVVFSAWESATRTAVSAVVNSDGNPARTPGPRQVTLQVIPAVSAIDGM